MRRVYYFCLWPIEGGTGFSSEIGWPARFGDRKSGKSSTRHAQHVTIRSAPRSCPIKHTSKYRFLSGSMCPGTPSGYSRDSIPPILSVTELGSAERKLLLPNPVSVDHHTRAIYFIRYCLYIICVLFCQIS